MKLRKRVLATAVITVLAACSQNDNATSGGENWLGESTIGTINGEGIPESLFRRLGLNMLQKQAEDLTAEERTAVIEQLVAIQLVAADGERKQLGHERTIAAEMELLRLQFLASAAVERYSEENPPGEADLRALYEERIQNLSGTEFKARHILVETEAEAASVIEQLDAGGSFEALAEEFSTGPTGPSGGDLGWFTPDRMVEPFGVAVQALEIGAYTSEPVQTQFGWHVILVEDSRDQQPPGIESMRTELTQIAQRQKIEEYIDSLRAAANVVVE